MTQADLRLPPGRGRAAVQRLRQPALAGVPRSIYIYIERERGIYIYI